jgi:hypothetical protein
LAFTDEPLVKIGISNAPLLRWAKLDERRFNFGRSSVVFAKSASLIRMMERDLKAAFNEHRREPKVPLSSGNTEVFDESVLPEVMRIIESFRESLPNAEVFVQHDLSAMVSNARRPSRTPVPMVTVALRWPKELVNALMLASVDRRVARQKPFLQQEITAEAFREWLERHANKTA